MTEELINIEEDLKEYIARDNIIEDVQVYMKRHSLNNVAIFLERSFEIKNVSAAFALKEFFEEIGIEANVIISNPYRINEIYKGTHKLATGDFLGITIGCKELAAIDDSNFRDTFVLFNVCGPLKIKGFGVLNYTEEDVSCTAEIVFKNIYAYCKKNDLTISQSVAQHLYTALIAGTKRYGSNVKRNTFTMAKVLLDCGANYKQANYLCEKKDPVVLQIQEQLYKNLNRTGKIGYSIIKKNFIPENCSDKHYQDTLSLFKKIDQIDVWALFVDCEFGYYDCYLQGKEINNYDMRSVAIKNNGFGDHTQGMCKIRTSDINKVLSEIQLLIEKEEALEE